MNTTTLATAATRERLEELINKYFYSDNYIITEGLKIYNKRQNKTLSLYFVEFKKGRYIFKSY